MVSIQNYKNILFYANFKKYLNKNVLKFKNFEKFFFLKSIIHNINKKPKQNKKRKLQILYLKIQFNTKINIKKINDKFKKLSL